MPGQTIVEKILSHHSGRKVSADELIIADVDAAMASDTTAPLAIKAFHDMGGELPWNPQRTFLVIDHASPAPNELIAGLHNMMREFAARTGAILYDIGDGICHQLMVENDHVRPGDLFFGADSHTCIYGGLAAFASGVGSTDLAAVLLTGKIWLKVPRTIKVNLTGPIPSGVSAKDIALATVGQLGLAGATYQALEFHGEVMAGLSLDSRMTIANMAVEMGAKVGLVHPAGLKLPYAFDVERILPDTDACYERTVTLDVSELRPQVSLPHAPDKVVSIDDVLGLSVNYGFIGTCVNGRLEDLKAAAKVLKGRKVAPGVRLVIAPASRQIFLKAVKEGLVEVLSEAGATFLSAGCGPCVGTHAGVPGKGEVVISTGNRNFQGRMGNPEAMIYLASPATVAASVIAGEIADPGRFQEQVP